LNPRPVLVQLFNSSTLELLNLFSPLSFVSM
jgi:hypothetical protein